MAQEQSINSWVLSDGPKDVSSMTRHKDNFEDILDERRHTSDLSYCMKARQDIPEYKYNIPREPNEINLHVLNSARVKYRIEMMSSELGIAKEELEAEALDILNEMAHLKSIRAVRTFAYVLVKVFKSIFNRFYVNMEGVGELKKLIQEYPVLLMPSHRSYFDFLLVSYMAYHYNIPLPTIAAAMDFKGMKFFGWLLQKCGAFYIRRSFGSDLLYWAVFTEYVQTQLRNGDAPIEFFVEGTRSRTSKSYIPKIGMLSAALESYFKAEVPDIMIVPINISYERILEETLYAFELLGIPKPKESASGVFQARKVLSEDYGNVHMFIGKPFSIRQFSNGRINRVSHSLEPRYINHLSSEEAALSLELAYRVVRRQQAHAVISPFALIAAVLMQSHQGIAFKQLVKETDWLKRQAHNAAAYVDWPGNASADSVIQHYLSLHGNIIQDVDGIIQLRVQSQARSSKLVQNELLLTAGTYLMLASYRNQLMHVFQRTAMIALSINSCTKDILSQEELFKSYAFLEKLLGRDFVFIPGYTKHDFEHALQTLKHSGSLLMVENDILIKPSINKHTTFLSQLFEPFLLGYWILCQHLLALPHDIHGRPLPKKPKPLAKDAQNLALRLLQHSIVEHYEIASLDMLCNGLYALCDLGVIHRDRREEEPYMSPKTDKVAGLAEQIAKYIDTPPSVKLDILTRDPKQISTLNAKL